MPYIKPEDRQHLDDGGKPETEGELNYAICMLVQGFLIKQAGVGKIPNYAQLNAAIGVLECAKLEIYRRLAAPYEDGKRRTNGEVFVDISIEFTPK